MTHGIQFKISVCLSVIRKHSRSKAARRDIGILPLWNWHIGISMRNLGYWDIGHKEIGISTIPCPLKMGYWDIDPLKLGYWSFETGIFGIPMIPLTGPYILILPTSSLTFASDWKVVGSSYGANLLKTLTMILVTCLFWPYDLANVMSTLWVFLNGGFPCTVVVSASICPMVLNLNVLNLRS